MRLVKREIKKFFFPKTDFFVRRKNCAGAKKEISRPTFHPHDSRMASMEVLVAPRLQHCNVSMAETDSEVPFALERAELWRCKFKFFYFMFDF
jgi:hypothetical protein